MRDLSPGDQVFHGTFGEGVVQTARGDVATVRFVQGKPRTILASYLERQSSQEASCRAADAETLFDAYLMVDWSGGSTSSVGKNSVWYCLFEPTESRLLVTNPRTRQQAFEEIREQLVGLVGRDRRTLIGFDFPYGFPRGTVARLDLAEEAPAWRVMWDKLSLLVEDGHDNANNRFAVAADLNGGMTTGPAPFWCCPPKHKSPFLPTTKPRPWPAEIPEFRLADRAEKGPKPIWQLYGAGSVGSQALLGIPRLAALRDDPALQAVSHVWPFECGEEAAPPFPPPGTPFVLHVEIYPSLVPLSPFEETKDAAQVRALAEHFAHLDDERDLGPLFDLGALAPESRQVVVGEEGWILGV